MEKLEGCFMLAIIVFFVGALCAIPFTHFSSLGNGSHSGFITSVDYRGVFLPNYDIYFKTDNSSSQEDTYCVSRDNPQLAEELKQMNTQKKRITIFYHGIRAIGIGLCENSQIDRFQIDN